MSTPPRRSTTRRTGGEPSRTSSTVRPRELLLLGSAALVAAAGAFVVACVIGDTTGALDAQPDEGWGTGFAVALGLAGVLLLVAAALLGRAWGAERGGGVAPVVATAAACLLIGLSLVGAGTEPETSMPAPGAQRASSALAVALLGCAGVSAGAFVVALVRRPGESRSA